MGGKCSGYRKKSKESTKSSMVTPRYNGVEQYYNADIHHLLPNAQQSKPLYRFSNREQASRVDLNARIVDIREVEDDLRMESMFLKQNNNVPLGRCSTPDPSYCYHCDHKHRSRCCLYLGDKEDDINRYSAWTQDFEKTLVTPQNVKCIPEAVAFNSTPHWFPRYTWIKSDSSKASPAKPQSKPFFQPFQTTSTWKGLLDPNQPTTLTPYQQYIMQLRQLTQDIQSPTPCQYDPYNPYCTQSEPRNHGINNMQPFNNQYIYNGPVFMQQNNFLPYYSQYSYPYFYDAYQSQQQNGTGGVRLNNAMGYHPEQQTCTLQPHCASKAAHSHPNMNFPTHYAPSEHAPQMYANPTAQIHSEGISFPLWMLFTYNQTKNHGYSGNSRKRCAHQMYEPNGDCNRNLYYQPPANNCGSAPQMDVANDYVNMKDSPITYFECNPN